LRFEKAVVDFFAILSERINYSTAPPFTMQQRLRDMDMFINETSMLVTPHQ